MKRKYGFILWTGNEERKTLWLAI